MKYGQPNYWNLYVKNSDFKFYKDNIFLNKDGNIQVDKDMHVFNSVRVENYDNTANVALNWSPNGVARIRVGGQAPGATNGFEIQSPGDYVEAKFRYNGGGLFARGCHPYVSSNTLGTSENPWHIGYVNHIYAKEVRDKGKFTVNAQGNYVGYWMEIAYFVLEAQYADANAVIEVIDQGSSSGNPVYAKVVCRAKQQNPMGQAPACSLYMIGNFLNTNSSNFRMVLTENSSSRTVVRLYYYCAMSYSQLTVGFNRVSGIGGIVNLVEGATPISSLPSGTQYTSSFMPGYFDFINLKGAINTNNLIKLDTNSGEKHVGFYNGDTCLAHLYGNSSARIGMWDAKNGRSIFYYNYNNGGPFTAYKTAVIPDGNNAYTCGSSSNRWSTVYAVNALNTSDESYKENIEYLDPMLRNTNLNQSDLYNFYKNDFKLASYNYKGQEHTEYGFIAQDLANNEVGKSLVVDTEEGYMYSIGSYISSVAGALQHEIHLRDEQIKNLEDRLTALEELLKGEMCSCKNTQE